MDLELTHYPTFHSLDNGLAAAPGLTRLMTTMLFGVSAVDPLTFACVAIWLCGVAFAKQSVCWRLLRSSV